MDPPRGCGKHGEFHYLQPHAFGNHVASISGRFDRLMIAKYVAQSMPKTLRKNSNSLFASEIRRSPWSQMPISHAVTALNGRRGKTLGAISCLSSCGPNLSKVYTLHVAICNSLVVRFATSCIAADMLIQRLQIQCPHQGRQGATQRDAPRHFPVKAPVPECAVQVSPNQAEHRLFGNESFQPFVKTVVADAGVITADIRSEHKAMAG
jgi:hypothetical protein